MNAQCFKSKSLWLAAAESVMLELMRINPSAYKKAGALFRRRKFLDDSSIMKIVDTSHELH
jgi:hypothetical protein